MDQGVRSLHETSSIRNTDHVYKIVSSHPLGARCSEAGGRAAIGRHAKRKEKGRSEYKRVENLYPLHMGSE